MFVRSKAVVINVRMTKKSDCGLITIIKEQFVKDDTMQWSNTSIKYGTIHRLLHWITAVLILLLLMVGGLATRNIPNELRNFLLTFNQSFGIMVGALTIFRIFWYFLTPKVKLPAQMKAHEVFLAKAVHCLLYITTLMLVISGLLSVRSPITLFWDPNFTLHPLHHSDALFYWMVKLHLASIVIIIGLITLHFLAALKHHFIDKDDVLRSML